MEGLQDGPLMWITERDAVASKPNSGAGALGDPPVKTGSEPDPRRHP
jgi:hypothetical protein